MKTKSTLLLFMLAVTPWLCYAQNYTFSRVANCPQALYASASFSIGNDVFVVSGAIGNLAGAPKNMTNNVWDYNTVTNTWTQKGNFPGEAVYGATSFTIGSLGYVVGGWDSTETGNGPNTTWQYTPGTDSWTQMADFGGAVRYTSGTFVLNGNAYVACGFKPYYSDMWEFNPTANTWTQKASLPGVARQAPISFAIGNYGYMGMGSAYNQYTGGSFFQSDWYKYDPTTDSWTQLNYFPGDPLAASFEFVLNGQGFAVTGLIEEDLTYIQGASNKVWEYSPGTDTWSLWGQFPDSSLFSGAYASVNNSGYMGTGASNWFTFPITPKFWVFGPGTAPYSCTATINSVYVNGGERNFQATGNFSPSAQINWNFGDSTTGTGTSVYHIFPAAGTYTVSLIVTDTAGGGCADTATTTVVITGISNCSVSISSTNIGSLYTLTASPTGAGPFTYVWTSPGDSSFYNYTPDPLVTLYPNYPTTFCLTITDTTGCQATACDTVTYVQSSSGCQTYLYVAPDPNYPGVYDCYVYHSGATPVSYLWSFGDGDTSTLEFPTHAYLNPGYYNICLTITDSVGCTSTFCDSAFYAFKVGGGPMTQLNAYVGTTTTGIQQVGNPNAFAVYPNPASDELNISAGGNQVDRVTIYNAQGQKVSQLEAPASNIINVNNLASGMYFIDISVGENSGRVKFVKIN